MNRRHGRNHIRSRASRRHSLSTSTILLAASLLVLGMVLSAAGCGDEAAASDAEFAVQEFLTASENKDVDAVLGLMDPQLVAAMEDELTGTGMTMDDLKSMLSEEFFPYESTKFSNIELQTTDIGENQATVEIVGGTLTQTIDGATETLDAEDSDEPLEFYLIQIDRKWYIDFESM